MIRINLLPIRESRKRESTRQQAAVFGAVLVCVLIGLGYFYFHMEGLIEEKQKRIAELEIEIKKSEELIKEVRDFEEQKKVLEEKRTVLEELKKNRTGPALMLDELRNLVPEKMWLTSLKEKDKKLVIEGEAVDEQDVPLFLRRMGQHGMFSDVRIVSVERKKSDNKKAEAVHKFSITCKVTFSLPGST
jgi:type IV pilus assembly protein PilN